MHGAAARLATIAWLIRRTLRHRWPALGLLALIVALGGAAALVSLGAADRTATAYSRYLDHADVGDLILNPSTFAEELDEVVRTLPGATSVTSDALFSTSLDDGAPRPLAELEANQAQVYVAGSTDGRHITMDRPALAEGRLADGPGEAMISRNLADAQDVELGDVLPVSFWGVPGADERPDTVVSPLSVEHVEVVGIGLLFPDAALPDALFPLQTMVVSPDVAARYQCPLAAPVQRAGEEPAISDPQNCSGRFWDYSVELADGNAGVAAVRGAVARANAEWNPGGLVEDAALELTISTTTAQEQKQVERSIQPIVTALVVLGIAAAAVTAAMAGIAVTRDLRRARADQAQWRQLGLSTAGRSGVVAAPLVVTTLLGLATALAIAWWLSPVGPAGTVRAVEPTPARQVSSSAWLGALALAVVLVVGISLAARWSAQRAGRTHVPRHEVPTVQRLIRRFPRPEVAEGFRAAYGRRGSSAVVASGGVATAVFLAAIVFATSLSALISTPRSYGWPWDVGVVGGLGWGGMDVDAVTATLSERDDVEGWAGLGFLISVSLDGAPVFSVVNLDHSSPAGITVIEGRLPTGEREVALGARTATERGIDVGDEVQLAGGPVQPGPAVVTGRVVLPALGPLGGERATPGTGMVVPSPMFDARLVSGDAGFSGVIGFIGISLTPGADAERVRDGLQADLAAWDTQFEEPLVYTEPVRPTEIVDAQSMRAVPLLVGGFLVVAASIGLTSAVVVSVRSRRRELATLRALGLTGRQLRDSVRIQSVATMAAALVVAVPVGVAIGRVAWRAFAIQLGVGTEPTVPILWILATVAGAFVIALGAAALPARVAARAQPGAVLRSE